MDPDQNHYVNAKTGYGHAVDPIPFAVDWKKPIRQGQVRGAAKLGVSIRWNTNWNCNGKSRERGETNSPHSSWLNELWTCILTATGWRAVVCLALSMILVTMCAVYDRQKTADRLRQTEAHEEPMAAQGPSAIRDRADARDQSSASIVTQAKKEIRHASDRNVAADATRRRMCQLSAQCAVFRADPVRVD